MQGCEDLMIVIYTLRGCDFCQAPLRLGKAAVMLQHHSYYLSPANMVVVYAPGVHTRCMSHAYTCNVHPEQFIHVQ